MYSVNYIQNQQTCCSVLAPQVTHLNVRFSFIYKIALEYSEPREIREETRNYFKYLDLTSWNTNKARAQISFHRVITPKEPISSL